MSDRIPCCIQGCKRTYPKARFPNDDEVMCDRHYRCDVELCRRFQHVKRRVSKISRRLNTRLRKGTITPETAELIWRRSAVHMAKAWNDLKAEAQHLQDTGFFVGRRSRKPAYREFEDRHADRFEDQFRRLKKARAK